jgi:transposase
MLADRSAISIANSETGQGLSKLDIMRCLKRYIAREVYHHLTSLQPTTPTPCPK